MNIVINDINKTKAEEIVNELDKLIDEGEVTDWTIDETLEQDYRSIDAQWGERVSIKPYYRNQSLFFAVVGEDERDIKYANATRFVELMLNHFYKDIKVIEIINI